MTLTTDTHHTIRVECDNCGRHYHGRRMPEPGQTKTIHANTCIYCRAANGHAPKRNTAGRRNHHPPHRRGRIQVA